MKRFDIIVVLVCSTLLFSCSKDEGGNTEVSLVGTWNAISFTTSVPFDLNGDGESSADIMQELSCFGAVLIFREDKTFSSTTSDIFIEQQGESFIGSCKPAIANSGTYEYSNGTLTTVNDGQTIVSAISFNNAELTVAAQDRDLGRVTVVYRRG